MNIKMKNLKKIIDGSKALIVAGAIVMGIGVGIGVASQVNYSITKYESINNREIYMNRMKVADGMIIPGMGLMTLGAFIGGAAFYENMKRRTD
jgi:hypothetical protein